MITTLQGCRNMTTTTNAPTRNNPYSLHEVENDRSRLLTLDRHLDDDLDLDLDPDLLFRGWQRLTKGFRHLSPVDIVTTIWRESENGTTTRRYEERPWEGNRFFSSGAAWDYACSTVMCIIHHVVNLS